ncbi:hypothetical protein EDM56_10515 [Brevibacillus fluminis]|uniref:Uncharacterized protein n=1 Tax=Brevibacillus fluminis TaxID=511487 RepID=A0A3M8DND4_9BACL|nr:hypothetical protein [Brevibacillus fluminis]RNB89612.1 hypothetical protein EDM56_10515 [Brevibacillus fluminis]
MMANIPVPSIWGINSTAAGRPAIWGTLTMDTISNNRITGTINFRGTPIPILGYWDEKTNQIMLESPYATFSGELDLFDNKTIGILHYVLQGRLLMKPTSSQAGEYGSWIATTDVCLKDLPHGGGAISYSGSQLPPVGVFVTSANQANICR